MARKVIFCVMTVKEKNTPDVKL